VKKKVSSLLKVKSSSDDVVKSSTLTF